MLKKVAGWPVFWFAGQRPPLWARLLAWVYCAVVWIKRYAYRHHWLQAVSLPVPVVVVGNRVVGGTGKTPLLLALIPLLQAQGWRVGIISRGYGREDAQIRSVTGDATTALVGDEPLLLWQQLQVPVWVGSDRVAVARALLRDHPVDVIVLDDGWQHLALANDYVIEVIDIEKGYGNGHCLPAGPLREPVNCLPLADLTLYNGRDFSMQPSYWRNLLTGEQRSLMAFQDEVVAMAGIGNPQRFFNTLIQLGLPVVRAVPLADHQMLSLSQIQAFDDGTRPLVMTVKDAVRCQGFAQPHWWALVVETQVDASLFEPLIAQLYQRINKE